MRNTPSEGYDTRPAQILLGRRCKTLLPITFELLRPQNVNSDKISPQITRRQLKQAKYYNRSAKPLPPLEEGDIVRMRPHVQWRTMWPKAVTKRLHKRSYLVETDQGSYQRNRTDIKKTREGQLADAPVEPNSTTTEESQAKATPMKPVVPNTVSA